MATKEHTEPLQLARQLLDQGDFAAATEAYERACVDQDCEYEDILRWAHSLLGQGRVEPALEKLEKAEAIDPGRLDGYASQAVVLFQVGRHDEALDALARASRFVSDAALYLEWANMLLALERWEQARWKYERAITLDGDLVPAHLGAGVALLNLDLPEEAEAKFAHVAEHLDPENGPAFAGWGRACFARDEYGTALQKFRRALELEQGNLAAIEVHIDSGDAHTEQRQFQQALDAYDKAIELEPEFPEVPLHWGYRARAGSARVLLERNLGNEALARIQSALVLLKDDAPGASAYMNYLAGVAETTLKRYSDAIRSFRRAAEISDVMAVYSLNAVASLLATQGKYREAWQELASLEDAYDRVRGAMGNTPDEDLLVAYGSALMWLDQLDRAEEAFTEASTLKTRNVVPWAKLMTLYLERRDCEPEAENGWHWKAREAFMKAVPLLEAQLKDMRSEPAAVGLGQLYLLMSELDPAQELLTEAAALNRESMLPYAGLGMVFARKHRFAAAAEEFQKALNRDPDNLTLRCHLADAYFRLNRHEAAVTEYETVLRTAPKNIGAQIGMGEVLTELAEKVDDSLYEDAEVHFTKAIRLAESMVADRSAREASSRLNPRQWAAVHYARGYARVKIYEVRSSDRLGRLSRETRRYLEGALRDFEVAAERGLNTHRAKRSAEIVRERTKRLSSTRIAEERGPLLILGSSLLLLVLVQIFFYGAGGFSGGKNGAAYVSLTMALLAFAVAALYLPQILKLKVGGMELQKNASDPSAFTEALRVHRQPIGDIHSTFAPEPPRSRRIERGDRTDLPTSAVTDARKGQTVAAKP